MKLPYIQKFADSSGGMRYYYRRKGCERVPLPDPDKVTVAVFMEAYHKAAKVAPEDYVTSAPADPKTLGALLNEYLVSPNYKQLKPNSQRLYRTVIAKLRGRPSVRMRVCDFRPVHIERLRDDLGDTPGMANSVIKVVRVLLSFGVRREYADFNVAAKIEPLRVGEWRSWTDDEIVKFAKRWPAGTMEHTALMLALYTGQRRSDLARMTWAHRSGGLITVVQQKTGAELVIPEHRELTRVLDAIKRQVGPILHTARGKPFTEAYLGGWFAEAIEEAKLPDDCVLHGLRKAAARRLAEVGCSDREIMAITGHQTPAEVTRYTRQADQKAMGRAAIVKLERGNPRTSRAPKVSN